MWSGYLWKKSFISGWGGGKTTLKKRGNSQIWMWRNMKLRDQSISGVHGRIHWKSSVTELFCSRGIPELVNSIRMKKVHQNINHWREIARRVTFEFHSKIIETFLRIGSFTGQQIWLREFQKTREKPRFLTNPIKIFKY